MAEETTAAYPAEASREMIDAGVFYGRKKSKTNPKMRPFVLMNRGGIEIIDLEKTAEAMERAAGFVKEKVRQDGLMLLVGTEPAAEAAVLRLAKRFGIPYVATRWVGGAITNFKIIAGRIEHLKKLRSDLASGAMDKYTKKERLELEREKGRLEELMGGLEGLTREPDFLIMVDPIMHRTAVREARRRKIPIVALGNVDADPDEIDHLVPGNDKAKKSIDWFFAKIERAIEEGIAMRVAAPAAETVAAGTGGAEAAANGVAAASSAGRNEPDTTNGSEG